MFRRFCARDWSAADVADRIEAGATVARLRCGRGVPVFGLPGNPVAALVCAAGVCAPRAMAAPVWSGAGLIRTGYALPAGFEKQKKPGDATNICGRGCEMAG